MAFVVFPLSQFVHLKGTAKAMHVPGQFWRGYWMCERYRMQRDGDRLSNQERRVIFLIAQGKTNEEIAYELGLARSTVKHYVRSICQKLNALNRAAAAVRYYSDLGLLT